MCIFRKKAVKSPQRPGAPACAWSRTGACWSSGCRGRHSVL